jgi:hypothetical protein
MRNLLIASITSFFIGCSGGKYLQQCQIDGVESLSKGMSEVSNKLTAAYSKVIEHNTQSYKNTIIPLVIKSTDTLFEDVKKPMDSIAGLIATYASTNQASFNNWQAGLSLSTRLCDLLKAISSSDFYKTFDDNKDNLLAGADSLASKFNSISSKKIQGSHGQLFSAIAFEIGKHKLRKTQKKYFKTAIDTGGIVLQIVLAGLQDPVLSNLNKDIKTLQNEYSKNYLNFQWRLSDSTIKLEDAVKHIDEIESVKKNLNELQLLRTSILSLIDLLQNLIGSLTKSVNEKANCELLYPILTQIDLVINEIDAYSSFLK